MDALFAPGAGLVATALIFLRLSAFFVSSPFPGRFAPVQVRVIFAAGLAFGMAGTGRQLTPDNLYLAALGEVLLGLILGYFLLICIQTFTLGGQAVGTQMGLATVGFADPLAGQVTLMASMYSLIALVLFVLGEGPERTLTLLYRSFELVPAGSSGWPLAQLTELGVFQAGTELFSIGLKAAAPAIAAVFGAQLVLAVLARAVPTLNLFVEGPALTVTSGVIGLVASVDVFLPLVDAYTQDRVEALARALGG